MISVGRENRRLVKPARRGGFDHGRLVLLTGLDIFAPSIHVEVIYAFQPPTPPTSVLEEGLAKVLTEFREWAGRFSRDHNGRLAIELNDQGVALMEARAESSLADAMPFNPSPFLQQLISPTQGVSELLLIQGTFRPGSEFDQLHAEDSVPKSHDGKTTGVAYEDGKSRL
eukprot:Gb_38699 [translate_table: standard]